MGGRPRECPCTRAGSRSCPAGPGCASARSPGTPGSGHPRCSPRTLGRQAQVQVRCEFAAWGPSCWVTSLLSQVPAPAEVHAVLTPPAAPKVAAVPNASVLHPRRKGPHPVLSAHLRSCCGRHCSGQRFSEGDPDWPHQHHTGTCQKCKLGPNLDLLIRKLRGWPVVCLNEALGNAGAAQV